MSVAIWSAPARADLAGIDNFYQDLAPDFAERVGRIAIAAGRFLAEHLHAGPALADGRRKRRVPKSPCLLIYRPTPGGVKILHIQHAASDWQAPE